MNKKDILYFGVEQLVGLFMTRRNKCLYYLLSTVPMMNINVQNGNTSEGRIRRPNPF